MLRQTGQLSILLTKDNSTVKIPMSGYKLSGALQKPITLGYSDFLFLIEISQYSA